MRTTAWVGDGDLQVEGFDVDAAMETDWKPKREGVVNNLGEVLQTKEPAPHSCVRKPSPSNGGRVSFTVKSDEPVTRQPPE